MARHIDGSTYHQRDQYIPASSLAASDIMS
jgi:hypothetical protein